MNTAAITLVWLTAVESRNQLMDFTEWKYDENRNLPSSVFSQISGLGYFDSDFLECLYADNAAHLQDQFKLLTSVEYFSKQLSAKVKNQDLTGFNAILSLTGQKGLTGTVNEKLFSFVPPPADRSMLCFLGSFNYQVIME